MVELDGKVREDYATFKETFQNLQELSEYFIRKEVFRRKTIESYVEQKDDLLYFIFRYFPNLYDQYFKNPPQLPRFSKWYFFVNTVFKIPDRWTNKIWWPKYGSAIIEYMEYYNQQLSQIMQEIETILQLSESE